jgi:hypothetical protein
MTSHRLLQLVSGDRLRRDLFHLSRYPLPFRKVNYTRPGQHLHSLAEADLHIRCQLEKAGRLTHVIGYSTEGGRELAEFIAGAARRDLGLEVQLAFKERVNDDDGMFINAGFRRTVMHLGSWPYADAEYHLPGDTPDRVDIENLARSTRLLLSALLDLDAEE